MTGRFKSLNAVSTMCYVNINSLKPGKTDVGKLKEEVSVSGNEF